MAFELGQEVETGGAAEIVEPVTVLQIFELGLEDNVEGRAEHTAGDLDLLGEAADPQIDIAETGGRNAVHVQGRRASTVASPDGAGAVQEGDGVRRRQDRRWKVVCAFVHDRQGIVNQDAVDTFDADVGASHNSECGGALADNRVLAGDQGMRAIGGDEVDHRQFVLRGHREIDPACIGLELAEAGLFVEVGANRVQRRNAGVAATGDVDRRKIERQTEQIVAQNVGDELVDLIADLAGEAAHQGAGRLVRGEGAGDEGAAAIEAAALE